jgi:hypothetical protein
MNIINHFHTQKKIEIKNNIIKKYLNQNNMSYSFTSGNKRKHEERKGRPVATKELAPVPKSSWTFNMVLDAITCAIRQDIQDSRPPVMKKRKVDYSVFTEPVARAERQRPLAKDLPLPSCAKKIRLTITEEPDREERRRPLAKDLPLPSCAKK